MEKDIEAYLVRKVKQIGGMAYKWVSPGNTGVPDRIVIVEAHEPVFVELKREKGGILSPQQHLQIKRLRSLGQRVEVISSKEEVDALVGELTGKVVRVLT